MQAKELAADITFAAGGLVIQRTTFGDAPISRHIGAVKLVERTIGQDVLC
jgi:hypothetical protein